MTAEVLQRDIDLEELGVVLCGSTSEIRMLDLGAVAFLGGTASIYEVHDHLKKLSYDELTIMKPKENVGRICARTPDQIVTVSQDDTLTLNDELGIHAVALNGALVKAIPRDTNIGFSRLVGVYKPSKNDHVTGPTLRRLVFNSLSTGPKVRSDLLAAIQAITGVEPNRSRKHLEFLERCKIVALESGTATLNPTYRRVAEVYKELTNDFMRDASLRTDGYNYWLSVVTGEHRDSRLIPHLAKRAVAQSGRSYAPAVESFIASLDQLPEDLEEITTGQLAQFLGQDTAVIAEILQRIERGQYEHFPLYRSNSVNNGASRVYERRWRRREPSRNKLYVNYK